MRDQYGDGLSLNVKAYLRYDRINLLGDYPSKHKLNLGDVGGSKSQ